MSNTASNRSLGLIGIVLAAFKLKERRDGYKQVSDEEVGRITLESPLPQHQYRDCVEEEGVRLLDTEIRPKPPRKRAKDCCVCCGLNCGLFWKAFGIVVLILVLWNAIKLVLWALKSKPNGLEHMPVYSTSLGCLSTSYLYNGGEIAVRVPMGNDADHTFEVRGGAVGTCTIAEGFPDSADVEYKVTIRGSGQELLNQISLLYPSPKDDGPVDDSRLRITTPYVDQSSCLRFDITLYVPKHLKRLHVAAHSVTQVQFDPESHLNLEDFFVSLYAMDTKSMILPHKNVQSNKMTLEIYSGWIVGDAAVVNSTTVYTQRGNGVANIRIHPTVPINVEDPEPAVLRTATGAGRTDVFFISDLAFPHRPIRATHISSRNADMYLTYRDAEYSGRIELNSKSYTVIGARPFTPPIFDDSDPGSSGKVTWTHWVGAEDGSDKIFVKSRGWTGVYF